MSSTFQPKKYQLPFDWQSKIQNLSELSSTDDNTMEMDVLFVGGGPAGLSGAIHLKQLCQKDFPDLQVGILEKAARIGGHSLSGAVINPIAFKKLFPNLNENELPFRQKVKKEKLFYLTANRKCPLPLPPTMKNKNFYTASLCEVLRWMEEKAEKLDINIFNSFTADKLLVDNNQVKGIITTPSGLNRDGNKLSNYQEPVIIRSKVLVLTDGSRGHLSQAWIHWKNIKSKYSQTYVLGVKEIWETPYAPKNEIWHTMGWPLPMDCFGGTWLYPIGENLVSLGLCASLNSPLKNLDVHLKLQQLKTHPLFANILKAGKCIEWGAKTIPEGGYHSMPNQLHDDGLLIAGDAANMVNVPALKGIHYAMTAGILSAETIFSNLKSRDFSAKTLKQYDYKVKRESCIAKELYPVRNVRQAFDKNIFWGLLKSGLMFLTKGLFPGDSQHTLEDAEKVRTKTDSISEQLKQSDFFQKNTKQDRTKTMSKLEAVYLSGNKTRDDIPPHLIAKEDLPEEIQKFYEDLCPAGVYERKDGKLIINAPNCVDCKATDVLGPQWNPKEGGTGPNYQQM